MGALVRIVSWRVPPDLEGERLDRIVTLVPEAREMRLTRTRARELVERGHVLLDGRRAGASSHRVRGGALLRMSLPDDPPAERGEAIALGVLYQDDALLAVDKPAGLPSEPTRDPERASVLSIARAQLGLAPGAHLGLPHRLDRDTSGVLLLSKEPAALAALNASFQERTARKVYAAVVHGRFEGDERRIESFLAARHGRDAETWHSVRSGGRKAITLVRVLGRGPDRTLVECELLTGRTHQARVHLAEVGHPIVGDELYGAPRGEHARIGRHLLHARRVELPHPLRAPEILRVESPLPVELRV